MTDERQTIKTPHNVIMENRSTLTVTGVSDVDSFDEQSVTAYTDMGEMVVRGSDLHIGALNLDTGELKVTGTVQSIAYTDNAPRGGMFSRLFR